MNITLWELKPVHDFKLKSVHKFLKRWQISCTKIIKFYTIKQMCDSNATEN